jgi:hypothetical protein
LSHEGGDKSISITTYKKWKVSSSTSWLTIKDADNNNEPYVFQIGDKVRVGIKQTLEDEEYQLYKEFTITEEGTELAIQFTPEETDQLTATESKGILEVELVYNGGASVKTVYQEPIRLEGVVINE